MVGALLRGGNSGSFSESSREVDAMAFAEQWWRWRVSTLVTR